MRFFAPTRGGFTPRDLRKLGWLAALSLPCALVLGVGCAPSPTADVARSRAVQDVPADAAEDRAAGSLGSVSAGSASEVGSGSRDLVLAASAPDAAPTPRPAAVEASGPGEADAAGEVLGVFESASASAWVARAAAGEPAAAGVLRGVLASGPGTPAWSGAAEAMAGAGRVLPAGLADPLIAVVRGGGEGASAAASALRWVGGSGVTDELAALAGDDAASEAGRLAAVAALGERRTQRSAEALVGLLDAEPPAVRRASAEALGRLTGLGSVLGLEASAWRSWWAEVGRLDEASWQRRVSERLAAQASAARAQRQRAEARLVEAERALYRSASAAQRPEVLLRLLGDELEPIRRLGLELAEQRLLGGLPLEEPVRGVLRSRLADASAGVRQRAALLLRDLADAEAAALAAARLAGGQEPDEGARRSLLLLLARLPQPAGVDAVLAHLEPGALAGEAALAAAAAAEAGLLSPAQVVEARVRARALVSAEGSPPAAAVTLLGQVGEAPDWLVIERCLDSGDEGLRVAAARAWASSSRSLLPLALRAREPVIRPIVLAAAERRGERTAVFEAVLSAPPGGEDAGDAWERALLAMAARVDPVELLEALASSAGVSPGFAARLLGAALDRPEGEGLEPAVRVQLYLARSAARVEAGDLAGALADLAAVLELPETGGLDREAVRAVELERVRLLLAAGEYERAASAGSAVGSGERGDGSEAAVVELFLAEARRRVAAGEPGAAAAVLDAAGALAAEASSSVRREIEALTARVGPGEPASAEAGADDPERGPAAEAVGGGAAAEGPAEDPGAEAGPDGAASGASP